MHAYIVTRYRPRFFDQVGHQTMYAYIGNKHFFTKSCQCQTYQNYEQPPQRLQNYEFVKNLDFFNNLVKKCVCPKNAYMV